MGPQYRRAEIKPNVVDLEAIYPATRVWGQRTTPLPCSDAWHSAAKPAQLCLGHPTQHPASLRLPSLTDGFLLVA